MSKKEPPAPPARTRTVAYVRVSTDKQAEHGISLEDQEKKVRAYADLYNLELVDILVDAGESAKSLERPALQRALAMLRDGHVTALLVVKLDRLTRSVRDLSTLLDYFRDGDRALMSVSEQVDTRTAGGRLVLNILTVISEWERETIGERTTSAMAFLKQRGKFCGGRRPPFGFELATDGETLVENPIEQEAIATARSLHAQGLSLRQIATRLAERGTRSRRGRRLDPKQVSRIIEE